MSTTTQTKHTAEPWHTGCGAHAMVDGESRLIAATVPRLTVDPRCESVAEANAARIVACVNALAGIEDPATDLQRAKDTANRLYNHCMQVEDNEGMGLASAILRALGG